MSNIYFYSNTDNNYRNGFEKLCFGSEECLDLLDFNFLKKMFQAKVLLRKVRLPQKGNPYLYLLMEAKKILKKN